MRTREFCLSVAAVLGAVALVGCAGAKTFQGQTALTVEGTPPPPPPPPPKPKPPPKIEKPARVEVRDNKIEIHEKIQFEKAKSRILEESHSLLNEIAEVIQKNPHIKKISIEGHASSEGNDYFNMKLSDDRAKAVRQYLVDKGIEEDKLVAKGFGETKPIADNDTEEGREKNRRVEFNIIEQDITKKKVEIDPQTGKEKVIESQKVESPKAQPAPDATKKAPAPEAEKKQ